MKVHPTEAAVAQHEPAPSRRHGSSASSIAANDGHHSALQLSVDTSPRMLSQRRLLAQISLPKSRSAMPVQRYTEEENGWLLAGNQAFAVKDEGTPHSRLLLDPGYSPPKFQHMSWEPGATVRVANKDLVEYRANFDNQPAMNEMFCGKFSESITGILEDKQSEQASPGRSMYTKLFPEGDKTIAAWGNHYAPVVIADEQGGDRATLETAVLVDYTWFGIYGTSVRQSFFYKTQIANMLLSIKMGLPDKEKYKEIETILERYAADSEGSRQEIKEDSAEAAIQSLSDIERLIRDSEGRNQPRDDHPIPKTTDPPMTEAQSRQKASVSASRSPLGSNPMAKFADQRSNAALNKFILLPASIIVVLAIVWALFFK